MKCLILAAGYATRLYPLTENFPKPLLKVGEKTILDWLVDDIDTAGLVDTYVVISNHKFAHHFENGQQRSRRILLSLMMEPAAMTPVWVLYVMCSMPLKSWGLMTICWSSLVIMCWTSLWQNLWLTPEIRGHPASCATLSRMKRSL